MWHRLRCSLPSSSCVSSRRRVLLRSSLKICTSSWRRTCRCSCPLRSQWSPTARSTVLAPQKLCFGFTSGSWCGAGLTLRRDSGSWPLVGTLYFKQDWTLAHLRPSTCCLSSSQWRLICRTTSPCPGTSRCLLLLPLQVAPQFRVGHLDPLSAGWLTICIAPARRPGWSVRCIRVATGRSRI